MTKEQLSNMAAEAYNRLGKNPPPYQWMDGYVAGYVAGQQNLQQCNVIQSQRCSEHKQSKLGYLQWHDDAERRTKAGQKQKQCPKCSLWLWEDEY